MAASSEEEAKASLRLAIESRAVLDRAQAEHDRHYLRFLRDARRAEWSWYRIGKALGLSEVAVRRHWQRNRHRADRTGRTT